MENPISISNLNDFIFCPVSIYFHNLEEKSESLMYQQESQISGSHAHKTIDENNYSKSKNILQGISVYSSEYNLIGKIDMYDIDKSVLTERKRKISTIYDGYVFQLYAQYFSLKEMGYNPKKLEIYSYSDNKKYNIDLPENDKEMYKKFTKLIQDINLFSFENFIQTNEQKCKFCIYEELCYFSLLKLKGGE